MEDRQKTAGGDRPYRKSRYLGCLTKKQLIILSITVGLVFLLITITVPAVLLTRDTGPSVSDLSFATGGDMLDFLIQSGDISKRDGLLPTWFHRANSKEAMNKALASNVMILEADVTLEGYGTPTEKPIPIMAHPPDVTSDNTLDQWLDAVLASRKGIKLDFKSLASVGLSLDLLRQKNSSQGVNRPVWLNADILKDPLVPAFIPIVNGTRFLELVQEKFPDVTLSLGWMVLGLYTRSMVEEMYNVVKELPQKVTFPLQSLFVRKGWPHISWLLSQSSRFSLTLWQGEVHPNVSDLLFVRDNTHPARVYYDIYEPTLSQFKRAAEEQGRLRHFYPGGDLMDFLCGSHQDQSVCGKSLSVRWVTVTNRTSLSGQLSDSDGGMFVLRVGPDSSRPDVPVVQGSEQSSESLTLEDILELISLRPDALWGLYLRLQSQLILEPSLSLVELFYSTKRLYRPVWIGMDPHSSYSTQEFVSSVERLFPCSTLVLTPEQTPAAEISQRLALHLTSVSPPQDKEIQSLLRAMDTYDILLEEEEKSTAVESLQTLVMQLKDRPKNNVYVISKQF